MANDMHINIMMIGGKRCGKTTVLAAMKDHFDKEFGRTNLTIKSTNKIVFLNEKIDEMKALYNHKETRFTPEDNETANIVEYNIELSLKHKPNGKINYSFIDFPGEWLNDDSHAIELNAIVEKSSVIIVAIDTPFLMEEAPDSTGDTIGIYNEKRNRSGVICDFLKGINLTETGKMVIFVPLKCERYLHNEKMDLVNKRVHTAYRSFFDHINNDINRSKCTTAIAPIFTFGTVEFARFERNGSEIIIDEEYKTPRYPLYRFTDEADSEPEPKYCEQPLLYVLLYILKCAEASKKKQYENVVSRFFLNIGETFFKMPSAADFLKEITDIQAAIKVSGDGYEIITDPFGLKGLL